jgi:DNA-binding transcriptional LysR family regulator
MELRHLRYFVAVAEELHFGRAAERLCIAQPPLSMQIRQLEDELGFRLFDRTNRSVALTPAGTLLLEEVRHNLRSLQEAVLAARRVAKGETGWLGVGFVGSATYELLPRILRTFRAEYPGVELVLRELVSSKQATALRDGRIHIGLARPPIAVSGIESEILLMEPLVAVLSSAHPLAGRKRLELRDLAEEDFVLFPRIPKPSYADFVIEACERTGFRPNVSQEAAEMHTAIGLVAAGLGVSLVPVSVRSESRPGLVFMPLEDPPLSEVSVIYRSEHRVSTVDSFLKICREVAFSM